MLDQGAFVIIFTGAASSLNLFYSMYFKAITCFYCAASGGRAVTTAVRGGTRYRGRREPVLHAFTSFRPFPTDIFYLSPLFFTAHKSMIIAHICYGKSQKQQTETSYSMHIL